MESNTPNSGKSPPLNTLPTPNNLSLTPSDVRVVTQTQDSERLLDNPDSSSDHQHLLDAICPAHNVDNTPCVNTPQAELAITPIISSPVRAAVQSNVAAELFKANPKAKRLKEHARNSGALKAQKKRSYIDPSKGLLWFLREKLVDDYADKLQSKFLSTAQKYKPAYEDWGKETNAGRKKNALAPFEDMRKSLFDGCSISRNYHRLLIEDFMLLEPQSRIIGIMNNKHPLM